MVEQQVWDELAADGVTEFWVYLRESADLSAAAGMDRSAQGQFVYDQLTQTAADSQAGLVELLDDAGADYQSFWISNVVLVSGDTQLLERVAARPEVAQVSATRDYELPEPAEGSEENRINNVEWGVERINAPEVWDEFGVRGEGIVVGSIDTGAQHDHPALVSQYRGNLGDGQFDHNYNWHDPSEVCGSPSLVPCDNNGHGTHVTGTMVGDDGGDNQIGVAPAAQWIAAKGCEATSCSDTALLSSGQFILAPTDLNNENPDPDRRPHIVNNSWGGGATTDPWYEDTVQSWVAAGIFPQFANGNNIPGCTAAGNPGNLPDSYSAGAFDINGNIAGFSNRGPSAFGDDITKPNIAAPGVNVRSAFPGDDYGAISGTSMASPHVSGVVALMWSAAITLERDIDATRDLLDGTAIDTEDLECGGTAENNNVWGQGELDAYAAVEQSPRGPTGTLTGTVTDTDTDDPINGADITITGEVDRNTTTNSEGNYSFTLPTGDYTVDVSAFGYEDATAQVTINEDQTTEQDFTLTAVDNVTINGQVTDGSGHGWALYAAINVAGTGLTTYTDPMTGQYTLTVPQNDTYTVTINAEYPGYTTHTQQIDITDTDVELDAELIAEQCAVAPGYEFGAQVGVMGDFNGLFGDFLDSNGIPTTDVGWGDDVSDYDVLIVNAPGDPGADDFQSFLDETDASGTGVVFVDTWSTAGRGNGVWLLWQHLGNPADRGTGFGSGIPYLYYEVVEEHPILAGLDIGDEIVLDESNSDKDHAWFGSYEGDGRQVIAAAGRADQGIVGDGVGVQERDNNRHVLLSMHGASTFAGPDRWADEGGDLFLSSMSWAAAGASFECELVDGGLVLGQVSDLNTGDGIAGATVTSDANPDESTTSFATPDDPNLGDGFYWMFSSLTGEQDFTATANGFSPDTTTVDVTASEVNEGNFALGAGLLVVEPDSVEAEVRLGGNAQRSFTVTNEGTAAAEVQFGERDGGFDMLGVDNPRMAVTPQQATGTTEVTTVGSGITAGDNGLAPSDNGLSGNASVSADGAVSTPALPAASPGQTVLTHSESQDIVAGNSVACSPDGGFSTTENSYLRTFALDDFGIGGDFDVTEVSFGIEASDPTVTVTVNLYTLQGDFTYDNLTLIGSTDTAIDPTELGMVTVPVTGTAPAGSILVVEVDTPDLSGSGRLFIGSNAEGQTAPSYLATDSCGFPNPIDTEDVAPGMHIVMNVTGEEGGGDVDWMDVTPETATLQPGESVTVDVTMNADVEQPGTYTGSVVIGHDTPHNVDPVGVTMVVTPPNNWGKITGTITATDCTGESVALEDALVQVNGSNTQVTLFTDGSGSYGYWMPVSNNRLELIVAASGYVPQTGSAQIRPRQETVANFHLTAIC